MPNSRSCGMSADLRTRTGPLHNIALTRACDVLLDLASSPPVPERDQQVDTGNESIEPVPPRTTRRALRSTETGWRGERAQCQGLLKPGMGARRRPGHAHRVR